MSHGFFPQPRISGAFDSRIPFSALQRTDAATNKQLNVLRNAAQRLKQRVNRSECLNEPQADTGLWGAGASYATDYNHYNYHSFFCSTIS